MKITKIGFKEARNLLKGKDALVCHGCSGNFDEWVTFVTKSLDKNDLIDSDIPEEAWVNVYLLTTISGRTDLLFVFDENTILEFDRLAIWIQKFGEKFGEASSWYDYQEKYAEQHGVKAEAVMVSEQAWSEIERSIDPTIDFEKNFWQE